MINLARGSTIKNKSKIVYQDLEQTRQSGEPEKRVEAFMMSAIFSVVIKALLVYLNYDTMKHLPIDYGPARRIIQLGVCKFVGNFGPSVQRSNKFDNVLLK